MNLGKNQKCHKRSKNGPPLFGISAESSEFQPDVRDSGRTVEIPAERSKFRPDVRKNKNEKLDKRSATGLPGFLVEAKIIIFEYEYYYSGVKNVEYY